MRHFILVTTLFVAPAAALAAGGRSCAVGPSPQEAASLGVPPQTQPSVPRPSPVNPQTLAARYLPNPALVLATGQETPPAPRPTRPIVASAGAPISPPNAPSAPGLGLATSHHPQSLTPEQIAQVPALQRIASKGASLTDLGTTHGIRTIFARNGDAFQVFYLVPDGSAAIGGIMWDSSGHDVTRDQVAPIPGVIPTVKIGAGGAQPSTAAAAGPSDDVDALKLVSDTTFGTIGPAMAPHLWMFIDPFCAFSVRAMQQLEPYILSRKLQLSVIPLSVLDYEDQGRSTPAAKIMVSEPPDQMVADWVNGTLIGSPPSTASDLLSKNMAIASALHLRGTPTMIWQNTDGSTGRADGIPPDLASVLSSIRS
jgi:hypothetical protein